MANVEHWIFAPTFVRARFYTRGWDPHIWRYARRDSFRGVWLDHRQTIHILEGFHDDELELELKCTLALSANMPQICDLRLGSIPDQSVPDLGDPVAVEAWLDA